MALQRLPGSGLLLSPPFHSYLGTGSSAYMMTSNTATHKIGVIGHVWTPDNAAKLIRKIHFLTGATVALNASSQIVIVLQDVDAASSNPPRGDGTDDQSVTIAGSSLTANTWITSGALSSDRAVNAGDLLCIEFRFAVFTSGDTWQIHNLSVSQAGSGNQNVPAVYQHTTSWQLTPHQPNVLLEFSDGTFGCLDGCPPVAGSTGLSFNSGSSPNERALKFSVPFKAAINGVCGNIKSFASLAHFDLCLYGADGTTVLASRTCSGALYLNSDPALTFWAFPETELAANTTYYLSMKPKTTGNCRWYHWLVNSNAHKAAWPLGTNGCMATRTNGGSWTDTDTAIPMLYPRFSKFDDGNCGFPLSRLINLGG